MGVNPWLKWEKFNKLGVYTSWLTDLIGINKAHQYPDLGDCQLSTAWPLYQESTWPRCSSTTIIGVLLPYEQLINAVCTGHKGSVHGQMTRFNQNFENPIYPSGTKKCFIICDYCHHPKHNWGCLAHVQLSARSELPMKGVGSTSYPRENIFVNFNLATRKWSDRW